MTNHRLGIAIALAMILAAAQATAFFEEGAEGPAIQGAVLDINGDVVAGCKVHALNNPNDDPRQAAFTAEADKQGLFSLPAASQNCKALLAIGEGYAPRWLNRSPDPDQPLRIVLSPGRALEGDLLDNGEPLVKATIQIQLVKSEGAEVPDLNYQASTDVDGKFQFTGLAPGRYQISLESTSHILTQKKEIDIAADGEQQALLLAAVKSYRVRGKVVDADTGKPIEDALVWSINAPEQKKIRTDKQGVYELTRLPAGWHLIHVSAIDQNYVSVRVDETQGARFPGTLQVLVHNQSLSDMDVRLHRGCEVVGKVKNQQDQPLGKLTVFLNNDGPQLSQLVRRRDAMTSEDGQFNFRGVPGGGGYYCLIQMPNGDGGSEEDRLFATARFDIDIKASPKLLNITVK